jgi:predicted DNA-binding transcriptional regulator AlpA
MQATERLLTPAEAADFLGISERKLWTLTKCREVQAILIPPRSVRYEPADLRGFIDRCKKSDGE